MDDLSAIVVVFPSPLTQSIVKDTFLKQLEELSKYDLFQIFLLDISGSIFNCLKTSVPNRLLEHIFDAVDKVDLFPDMVAPLFENESLTCHKVIFVYHLHDLPNDI